MSTCTLRRDPTPLGWGDHVRWQHEDDRLDTVGARYAEAIRGARRMRATAFCRVATGTEMFHYKAARIELEDGIPSYRFRRPGR